MRWIPVTEQLPPETIDVFLTVKVNGAKGVYTGFYTKKYGYCIMDMRYPKYEVLAWMPYPEPYEGEE